MVCNVRAVGELAGWFTWTSVAFVLSDHYRVAVAEGASAVHWKPVLVERVDGDRHSEWRKTITKTRAGAVQPLYRPLAFAYESREIAQTYSNSISATGSDGRDNIMHHNRHVRMQSSGVKVSRLWQQPEPTCNRQC